MHIYAFGSICRGEIDYFSDVDMLAITDDGGATIDPILFSIYSYDRIHELWKEGNPFAWHLSSEARIVFSSNGIDFIEGLGNPRDYAAVRRDCTKFINLFYTASKAIVLSGSNKVFELSNVYLAVRNFATCFSLGHLKKMEFSRLSALKLGEFSLKLDDDVFQLLLRSRFLSTRGIGAIITDNEIQRAIKELPQINNWFESLFKKI